MTDDPRGSGGGGIFAEVDAEQAPVLNPEVGQLLGPLRITAQLGEGAMAAVFRAEEQASGRALAVKVLKAELCQNIDAMRRFDKEALVAQRVRHPNLIEIDDVLHVKGFPPVLTMELLEGQDLGTLVRSHGPLAPEAAVAVAVQLCGALTALHAQNIVHRDLKPENVFLVGGDADFPIVKLLDFGLVKFLYGGDPFVHTRPGANLGTPAFMAPEQFSNPDIDSSVDIYSVGAVLYEMLTGRPPFVADTYAERLKLVTTQDPDPPSAHAPRREDGSSVVAPPLDAVVLAALARDPLRRIPDAPELARLLEASLQDGASLDLPKPDGGLAAQAWLPWALGAAVLVGLVGLAYLLFG